MKLTDEENKIDEEVVSFGNSDIPASQKSEMVKGVFDSVASRYDLMNDLMSGGVHRIWKRRMVEAIQIKSDQSGYRFLDVAGGTGDIAFRIHEKTRGLNVSIEVSDINNEMLRFGKEKAHKRKIDSSIGFSNANGEGLPYMDCEFDCYTIAFGIRNFTNIAIGLQEAYRVLKPGGQFICLEFSEVKNRRLSRIYDWYSFRVIPAIGKVVTGDSASYRYLVESIRKFPNQTAFSEMIESAGFSRVSYENLSFGSVAIHQGFKPPLK